MKLYYPNRPHALLIPMVTLVFTRCNCDSIENRPIHVLNLNDPVLESGFRPIDTGRDKGDVRKRGLVIDERISLGGLKRADDDQSLEADILGSSENESKSVERVSKDLRNFRNMDFANRCDNCNAFPWVPIARSIRMPPPSNINSPGPYPPPPNYFNTQPPHGGDNIPAASGQNAPPPPSPLPSPLPEHLPLPPRIPPQMQSPDQQPVRMPSSLNIPNPEFQYNRNIPIPSSPAQNFLTYNNGGGPGFKKEQPVQVTLVNRPEKPMGMFQSILNFFSPRQPAPKPPVRPPTKNMQLMPIGLRQPGPPTEPFPSATSEFEYEKPPPFPNPPYIPLNNDFKGLPPSMHLPPNKIFIYNIATDQNAKANQEPLPIVSYNSNARKPEVNTIRPVQHFANFRYAPMAIFPQPIPMHLIQPCHNCNPPNGGRFNMPQKFVPGIIPGAIRLPTNVHSIETVKSRPIAQYLASIEYPQEIIQSPLIDVSASPEGRLPDNLTWPHEPKLDNSLESDHQVSTPRPIYVPESVDNSLTGLQTATLPVSLPSSSEPSSSSETSSTAYPDLNPSAGNIITNLTGSPFRTTTDGYTGVDVVHSQPYVDFDWPVTQTTLSGGEDTTLTDYPTTLQPEVSSLGSTHKPTQEFNVPEQGRGSGDEKPSDPAFNYLSPPPVSADWSQDLWASRPTAVGSGFESTLAPLKKKKQIQIIVPYMVSPLDAEGKAVTSTENLITAINQLPETNRPTTLAERPFATLDHLQQFLDENRAKGNGIDLFRLQKNIDNWTAQGFSNHKHGQSLGLGQEDQVAQIHPAKNIPEDFLTGSEVFSNSFVSTYNSRDNEKRHIFSERRSVGFGNHLNANTDRSSAAAGPESYARESKVVVEGKRTSPSPRAGSGTGTEKDKAKEEADASKVWDSIPVAISPLTKEKVYMVTAVPLKDDPISSTSAPHQKIVAQHS